MCKITWSWQRQVEVTGWDQPKAEQDKTLLVVTSGCRKQKCESVSQYTEAPVASSQAPATRTVGFKVGF